MQEVEMTNLKTIVRNKKQRIFSLYTMNANEGRSWCGYKRF